MYDIKHNTMRLTMDMSGLHMTSIGRVAVNKERNSKTIEVWPEELLPTAHGEVSANPEKHTITGVDGNGKEYQVSVNTALTFACEWLNMDTNRQLPPDVRVGERVIVWQYKDTDKYYWTSPGWDDNRRRLETTRHVISNVPEGETEVTLDKDNTYGVEWSTHDGHITLWTSKSNGEDYQYTVQIDTKNSKVTVTDDVENFIQIDTPNKTIELNNSSTTNVKLIDKNIEMFCLETASLKAKDVKVTCETYLIDCDTYTTNAKTSYTVTTSKFAVKADDVMIDAPTSMITGDVNIGKSLVVGAGTTIGANLTVGGPIVGASLTVGSVVTGSIAAGSYGGGHH